MHALFVLNEQYVFRLDPSIRTDVARKARVHNSKSVQLPYGFYTCHLDRIDGGYIETIWELYTLTVMNS